MCSSDLVNVFGVISLTGLQILRKTSSVLILICLFAIFYPPKKAPCATDVLLLSAKRFALEYFIIFPTKLQDFTQGKQDESGFPGSHLFSFAPQYTGQMLSAAPHLFLWQKSASGILL